MARPTSKYFTPVIKKILEAKRMENIVIDQQFKDTLRTQMMSKISAAPIQKEVREVLNETGRGFDFTEFFNKFRYPLAIVPSMLLLIIVAVSAMNLPVSIKNEVIVPTATPTPATQVQNSNQVAEITQPSHSVQRLHTFSGSSVLPSSYRSGASTTSTKPNVIDNSQVNLNFDLGQIDNNQPSVQKTAPAVQPQPQSAPQQNNFQTTVPVQQTPEPNSFGSVVQFLFESQNQPEVRNNNNNNNQPAENIQPQPVQQNNVEVNDAQPQQQLVVQPQAQVVQPQAVQTPVLENIQTAVPTSANGSEKVQVNNVQPQEVPAQQVETTTTNVQPVLTTSVPLNTDSVQNVAQPETTIQPTVTAQTLKFVQPAPSYSIYYGADIKPGERAALESQLIAEAGDQEVQSMEVLDGPENNVIQVMYTFTDGSTDTKLFKKDSTGWHAAHYVHRYYYDNGFDYNIAPMR